MNHPLEPADTDTGRGLVSASVESLAAKLRFTWNEDHWVVSAKRKDTGKWQAFGVCHASAKQAVISGKLELVQLSDLSGVNQSGGVHAHL